MHAIGSPQRARGLAPGFFLRCPPVGAAPRINYLNSGRNLSNLSIGPCPIQYLHYLNYLDSCSNLNKVR